ncbi:RNA polymerase sigma factor [Adhaeribacter rhizoryzae]|uniref:Sigma-70 family RNA polymerase sigma factor n=1 Tax=Adhaeribacter rhizoryzae TaxID=2607907 RepID=A0A5M6D4S4_9BACT|nr:sigma-70 family RNA polymerase sigma factor [Adhaeribacter rhizoryzae]KAA5542517.1 sigma-70 family RNA polymerase sigma factor [Adhaeribacter rhizoryzae]
MPNVVYFSEEALLAGIRREDETAVAYLYKQHYPMVLHFVLSNNGTEEEAKDIYQEAVILFIEKIREETLELNCLIKTYLYSVCRRLWLKRLAFKSRFGGAVSESDTFVDVADDVVEYEEREASFTKMAEALVLVGEPCKTLLEDFYMQDLSMQEITEKFGYTNADNAKNQKYKCLLRLKKLFFNLYKSEVEHE